MKLEDAVFLVCYLLISVPFYYYSIKCGDKLWYQLVHLTIDAFIITSCLI